MTQRQFRAVILPLHETVADYRRKRQAREDGRKAAEYAVALFRSKLKTAEKPCDSQRGNSSVNDTQES